MFQAWQTNLQPEQYGTVAVLLYIGPLFFLLIAHMFFVAVLIHSFIPFKKTVKDVRGEGMVESAAEQIVGPALNKQCYGTVSPSCLSLYVFRRSALPRKAP